MSCSHLEGSTVSHAQTFLEHIAESPSEKCICDPGTPGDADATGRKSPQEVMGSRRLGVLSGA